MNAHSTDPNPVTRVQRKHSAGFDDIRLRRLRRGSTLIIISLLLPTVLINITAFSFPLLGVGFTALPYLRIFWILFAAPLLIGVFLLTTRPSSIKPPGIEAHRGNCLRAISIGYVVVVFCYSVFRILGGVGDPCCLEVEAVLGAVANVLGARYVVLLSLELNDASGARAAKRWALAYAITRAVIVLLTVADHVVQLDIAENLDWALELSWYGLHGWLWIWGFAILFRLRKILGRCLQHDCCIGCGYLLIGLTEPRCPECGRAFDLLKTGTEQAPTDNP